MTSFSYLNFFGVYDIFLFAKLDKLHGVKHSLVFFKDNNLTFLDFAKLKKLKLEANQVLMNVLKLFYFSNNFMDL